MDFFALLVAVQEAKPITRDGARYVFRVRARSTTPAAEWAIWTDGARVTRFVQTSGGSRWDERFSAYEAAPKIDEITDSEVHALPAVPACAGGAAPVLDGFCRTG